METGTRRLELGSVARHMASDPFGPAFNSVAEPVGKDIFRKYQAQRQPDQQSYDEFAHNRSTATNAPYRLAHVPYSMAIGPRQMGEIMVQ
jgi:hypothetical protein